MILVESVKNGQILVQSGEKFVVDRSRKLVKNSQF
jgi:hypothetical protein